MSMRKKSLTIGIDVGGTNTKFGIVNNKGEILKELVRPSFSQDGPDVVIKNLVDGIKELIDKKSLDQFRGVGIGIPGKANKERDAVSSLPNFKGWEYVELKKIMKKKLNIDIRIDNDANCAALGELYFGIGKRIKSFIMVTLGTGVGAGIILDGKIIRGESGGAGELGHITIDYSGPVCGCGKNGCVEAYVGNNYIKQRTIHLLNEFPDSIILDLVDRDLDLISPKIVSDAADKGDVLANKIIKDTGFYLGIAIASAINLLDIKTVVIGGGVSAAGDKLLIPIENSIKQHGIKSIVNDVKVYAAELKNSAGVLGAATLFYED